MPEDAVPEFDLLEAALLATEVVVSDAASLGAEVVKDPEFETDVLEREELYVTNVADVDAAAADVLRLDA